MRRWIKALVVLLLAFGTQWAAAQDRSQQFDTAGTAFAAGNFEEAKKGYEALIQSGETSPEVYYNLARTFASLDEPVAAALNYRRALLLDPKLVRARRALAELSQTTGLPATSFGWKEELSGIVPPRALLLAGTVLGWIGALLILRIAQRGPRTAPAIALSVLFLVLGIAAAAVGFVSDPMVADARTALVTSNAIVPARATPTDNSQSISLLPPGSSVEVLRQSAGWTYCRLPDRTTAWVPSPTLTRVVPGAGT